MIANASTNNTMGGTSASGARNIISASANQGVDITDSGTTANVVEGDYIGTDVTGSRAYRQRRRRLDPILVTTNNTIGGTVAGAGDVIWATRPRRPDRLCRHHWQRSRRG